MSLFNRRNRQLSPTPAGHALAQEMEFSLNHLAQVCVDIKGVEHAEIRLELYSLLAVKWLIPRLGDF
ncbi:MAG: hypothetical protein LPD71_14650 [Shewanella sp.]|nr:hypothetical protein [Shewanella sp.]MCF1430784.1 hypothetical protein [Shewanella sp.]MCF1439927.1 hypothetical protein [Shewanella sp.]MCF1458563.1 hypothetical protein [Shewanella sp.]